MNAANRKVSHIFSLYLVKLFW